MSITNNYRCIVCGYTADVWDDPDKGMIATVDTRHCLGCKSLVEVAVIFHGNALIEDLNVTLNFIDKCPDCDSSNVQLWDIKHSCPKCGEHMTKSFIA